MTELNTTSYVLYHLRRDISDTSNLLLENMKLLVTFDVKH